MLDPDGRFLTAEAWMRLASLDDRVAAVRWLDGVLARPPLHPPSTAFRNLRFLLTSLAADIEATAIDPESPMTEAGQVPQPDPRLYEEPEEPPRTSLEQLKDTLGGIFR